ncbi:MAG: helix-turn-helix domain-containing protein [Clostridiales bacterium]|jgi:transcriptional regulator with XRE-family HTH domain|nr:helix-turn-helix domain-containing protein [Clostridiales bacterium]
MKNFRKTDLKKIGIRICHARKELNLTQEKAAELAFITSQFWSLLESGHERASVDTYLQIADVLGLTLDDIFYDDAIRIRLHKAFSKEGIIGDCTISEKAILSETMLISLYASTRPVLPSVQEPLRK